MRVADGRLAAATTSAKARSSARPASISARAWSPASDVGSRPSGAITYGIGLQREDLVVATGRRLARADHDGGVDVADLEADPRLEQRPRAVHLDVALVDRRPGADAVDVGDEGERRARQVVAASRRW